MAVQTGAQHDVDADLLADRAECPGVSSQARIRHVDHRGPTGLTEAGQLAGGQRGVVQQAIAAELAQQVDEDVLVHERDAELSRRDRSSHCDDRWLAHWVSRLLCALAAPPPTPGPPRRSITLSEL